jgi:uncharacterized protein (TIGR02145 family)
MKHSNLILFACIIIVFLLFGCDKDDPVSPENRPPVIESITSTPPTSITNKLAGGATVQITVVATDPDRDELSYAWQAEAGRFDGNTDKSTVRWVSPFSDTEKTSIIKVTVSDGALTVQGDITVYVDKTLGPTVSTSDITEISETTASGGGNVTDDGGSAVTARGVVWSISQGPNLESLERKDPYTTDGEGLGTFTSEITELEPGTVYYVRAYASNDVGTGYGAEVEFTTKHMTYSISGSITEDGSGLGGVTITASDGHSETVTTSSTGEYTVTGVPHGADVTITPTRDGYSFTPQSRSIENISQNETGIDFTATLGSYNISGRVTEGGSGLGGVTITATGGHSQTVMTSSIDRQTAGYYTLTGVPHGADVTITPTRDGYSFTLQSRSISNITQNQTGIDFAATGLTYSISGRVTEGGSGLGGVTITASGGHSQTVMTSSIDRQTAGYYTLTDIPHGADVTITPTRDGYSFTPQSHSISNITQNQTGIDFTATEDVTGTVTDIDNNVYQTVKIGNQWWMAENLITTRYRDGVTIPNVTDDSQWENLTTGAWAYYNNDASNDGTYGKLYNWYAVDDTRGLCPEGWHVPSDDEWTMLVDFLGGREVAGGKMKSTRTDPDPHPRWRSPNTGATNESGFSGLPGHSRFSDGSYGPIGYYGFWWSSTELTTVSAWFRVLFYNNGDVYRDYGYKRAGFSVRCLRDD